MSSLAFLLSELQALASETKRKHPDIREAAEKSLALLRSSPEQATINLTLDNAQSQELLRPVFMGCATRNAKVVAISLGSLQRLIALKAVPLSVVPSILDTMGECITQGVDIQLRVLQTLLSLITNFPAVRGDLLGDALILCFKLQESRIAVVSSTAAATLRQLVMFVVEKVVDEDRRDHESFDFTETTLPDGSVKPMSLSARDAFFVFEDLCLLTNSEKPNFLKLDSLPKTFALELIESVLTNYHELFRQHGEFILLLRLHLCPLLLRTLSDRPIFPLTLRSTRVVFLLLKQFSIQLVPEAEVFLTFLIKLVAGDVDPSTGAVSADNSSGHGHRPLWMRVLAMEVIRGLCTDAEFMRGIWDRYDAQESSSNLFASLVSVLKRLITEKPAILGVSVEMFGIGVSNSSEQMLSGTASSGTTGGYGFDIGSVAGIVAGAAGAAVSGMVDMMGSGTGLSTAGSTMKLQCIDQLDKADSPPIPEAYIYLLGLQSIISLCEGFASLTLPLYNTIVVQRPRAAGDPVVRAPPALDVSALAPDQPSTVQLRIVYDMLEAGWPGLLAALSFIVATNISDDLFADVLQSYQHMANVAGMLGLTTPRDAFLTNLAKFAIPARIVSSLDSYVEPPTPRTSGLSENLGLTSAVQPPGLSDRNLACLMVLINSALFLAGSLGSSWFDILEALQNADYVLTAKGSRPPPSKRAGTAGPGGLARSPSSSQIQAGSHTDAPSSRHPLIADVDAENVQRTMQRLFDTSKNLEDSAFTEFITALCRLSAEMVDMQSDATPIAVGGPFLEDSQSMSSLLSPSYDSAHRRRVSGIHLPRTLRTGDFGISKLGKVALLNSHRLTYRQPEVAWSTITRHLLTIVQQSSAPHAIRIQASHVLDDILIIVTRNSGSAGEMQAQVQHRILDVLAQQIMSDKYIRHNPTVVDIMKMGLETLHQILQTTVHSLIIGWDTIFEMLGSVCETDSTKRDDMLQPSLMSKSTKRPKSLVLGQSNDRMGAALVRIAFESLKLVCDTVSTLSPENLRLCISTIGRFGRQTDTNIALTAAGSLLWGISDSIQAKRKDSEREPEYSELWMFLLLEVLGLCTDARPEVRVGAIQTLFRAMQLYGATLSMDTWDECLWKVTFPLLDSITAFMREELSSPRESTLSAGTLSNDTSQSWDESKTLALQSIGSIFGEFLTDKLVHLSSFEKAWDALVRHVQDAFLLDRSVISTAALRCLEKATKASESMPNEGRSTVNMMWKRVWTACDEMGQIVQRRANATGPENEVLDLTFDQESLLAFLDVVASIRGVSRQLEGSEWPLDRLTRLMSVLKGILTYPHSLQYRPDIDNLTPVQAAVVDTIENIDLSVEGSPSLVLSDLSEYATLPFIAAFDVRAPPVDGSNSQSKEKRIPKQVTYIGLTKRVMSLLATFFEHHKDCLAVYVDGTLEAIVSAFSVPIKLKYDCPAPSKFGKDLPLWKTATSCFLQVIRESSGQIHQFGDSIPNDRIEGIWHHVLEAFRGGILADCSIAESFPADEREEDENFDLALIASLEVDVVPLLGDTRVPDYLLTQLAKTLDRGSILYDPYRDPRDEFDTEPYPKPKESRASMDLPFDPINGDVTASTSRGIIFPRERFAYWCFDLLFLICSDTAKDQEAARRRVAALCIPALLGRCRSVLKKFLADQEVLGPYPFSRIREEELVYVLHKLCILRLWSGSLSAALSEFPSKYSAEPPSIDPSLPPSVLLPQIVKRSSKAHLLHFYHVFCTIAALPRRPASAWMVVDRSASLKVIAEGPPNDSSNTSRIAASATAEKEQEYDPCQLAASCLKEIGIELGIEP